MLKKSLLLLTTLVLLASCKPLDRLNPTDPKATNYIGITFYGEFGELVQLTDFCIMNNEIFTCDYSTQRIGRYTSDGSLTLEWVYVDAPTGICGDGQYLYVVELITGSKWVVVYDTDNPTNSPTSFSLTDNGSDKIALAGTSVYITAPAAYKIYQYSTTGVAGTSWGSQGDLDGQFETISDIETHSSGDVLVADSTLDRITIFNSSGVYQRMIEPGCDISGIGVNGNIIYAATPNGVYELSYIDGHLIRKWADYGEGAGKVTQAGMTEAGPDFILVALSNLIKKFAP